MFLDVAATTLVSLSCGIISSSSCGRRNRQNTFSSFFSRHVKSRLYKIMPFLLSNESKWLGISCVFFLMFSWQENKTWILIDCTFPEHGAAHEKILNVHLKPHIYIFAIGSFLQQHANNISTSFFSQLACNEERWFYFAWIQKLWDLRCSALCLALP